MAADDDARVDIPLKASARDPARLQARLRDWLRPRLGAGPDLTLSDVTAPGGTGVANETLLFAASWERDGRARTEGFVARVANERPLYIEADIEIHAKVYEALADVPDVPVPRVYGYEPDPGLLGAPFFVMERIDGEVPGDQPSWVTAGFVHDASPARRRAMWEDAVRVLAALHQVDAATFAFLAPRTTSGLEDHLAYWQRTMEQSPDNEVAARGYAWLLEHLPPSPPTAFSWGDARFANVMFRDDEVVAVFDWDTASMSGPLADLAWWRIMDGGAAAELPGIGTADELVARWEEHTGRSAGDLTWYEVFTSFRLTCILNRLFHQMAADGLMPVEAAVEQATRSGQALDLTTRLDALGG